MSNARTKKVASRPQNVMQERLVEARPRNLRQLLLRTTRSLSAMIQEEIVRRGYSDVRLSHSTLLAHLDLQGNTITQVAERAQMTKQAMGLLAEELEAMGYITRRVDERDARARVLAFTPRGRILMLDTLKIIDDLERQLAQALGRSTMDALRAGLQAFVTAQQGSLL